MIERIHFNRPIVTFRNSYRAQIERAISNGESIGHNLMPGIYNIPYPERETAEYQLMLEVTEVGNGNITETALHGEETRYVSLGDRGLRNYVVWNRLERTSLLQISDVFVFSPGISPEITTLTSYPRR